MANGHGGARPGAGRKSKGERFPSEIAAAERQIADRLPRIVDNLLELADGGYQRVRETWEPAGTVLVEVTEELPAVPIPEQSPTGDPFAIEEDDDLALPDLPPAPPRLVKVRRPAFPDKDPAELVLVKREVEIADRDRAAGIYLTDRILGKPTARVEAEVSGGLDLEITDARSSLQRRLDELAARTGAAELPAGPE